jgi:hypothetical protein
VRHRIGIDDAAILDDVLIAGIGNIFVAPAELEAADIAATDVEIILGIGGGEILAWRNPLQARLRIGPGGKDPLGGGFIGALDGEVGMEGAAVFLLVLTSLSLVLFQFPARPDWLSGSRPACRGFAPNESGVR